MLLMIEVALFGIFSLSEGYSYRVDCLQFCNEWLEATPSGANMKGEGAFITTGRVGQLQYGAFCNAAVCAVFPNFYNKFRPPKTLRTGRATEGSENAFTYTDCVAEDTNEVLTVNVDLDAKVENVTFHDQYGEISFDMTVGLAWQDPLIDICVCSDASSQLYYEPWEIFLIANEFEHYMWTPDLEIWNVASVGREHYLVTLNDIFIRQIEGCPANIFLLYKLRTTIRCSPTMDYFPFDKNICHFRMGSDSFGVDTIQFRGSHPAVNRIEVGNYYVYQKDLTEELRVENKNSPAPSKLSKTFKLAGFSLIVERIHNLTLYRYGPTLAILSIVNVLTWLVPHTQNKLGLLTCVLVSYMLEMTHLLETTPRVVEGMHTSDSFKGYNFIVMYGWYNILLIMFTFTENCLVVFLQRLLPKIFTNKCIQFSDWVFFTLHVLILVMFNVYWWIWNPNFPAPHICHNSDRHDVHCEV